MDRDHASRIIKAILRGERLLERSAHFWEQADVRGYDWLDAQWILRRHDRPVSDPEWDERCGYFKTILEGTILAGRPTRVVLGLREVGACSLITIFALPTRRRPRKRRDRKSDV